VGPSAATGSPAQLTTDRCDPRRQEAICLADAGTAPASIVIYRAVFIIAPDPLLSARLAGTCLWREQVTRRAFDQRLQGRFHVFAIARAQPAAVASARPPYLRAHPALGRPEPASPAIASISGVIAFDQIVAFRGRIILWD